MLLCGVDIGTTNLKVALFDETGRLASMLSVPTPRHRDALGPVTDAVALVGLVGDMIEAGWRACGGGAPIAAICTTGVGEDGVYVDAALRPLSAAIPWFDLRATTEAEELAACPAATPRAGLRIEPTRAAPKWLWSARHLPEVEGAHAWIALTDYPLAHWSGTAFISETLASRTGCHDVSSGCWLDGLLAASKAPPLPPVLRTGSVVGSMRDPVLLASGAVGDDTLLVAGGHDHPVAAHAIRLLAEEARVDSLGTANVICGDAPRFVPEDFDPLISFMASVRGRERVACLGVFEFTSAVTQFPGGMAAVRTVLDLPRIPGAPCPATPMTERGLLEWATLNARRMLERLTRYGVPEGPIYATGGWSRSRALLELRASIFGQPIHVPEERELSVVGAALLAGAAVGARPEMTTPVSIVEPVAAWQAGYQDAIARFDAQALRRSTEAHPF